MHKTGCHLDLRIVFTPSFEHEIPNLVDNLDQLRKNIWGYSQLGPQVVLSRTLVLHKAWTTRRTRHTSRPPVD